MIPAPFSDIFPSTQTTELPSNEEGVVFFGEIPQGYVGFLEKIASNYIEGIKWSWYIDDELIEIDIEEPIGDLVNPTDFNPPYVINHAIKVVAKNESDSSVLLEVFCDGNYYKIPDRIQPATLMQPLMLQPLEVQTQEGKSVKTLLTDIKAEIQNQVPKGVTDDKYLAITEVIYLFDERTNNGEPLNYTSCSIINTGPDNVYVAINEWKNPEAPITPGESHNFDFSRRGAIKKIYLICNAGETANVKIHAMK